jgi:His-Xaa-Ser system protein HxsD
MPQRPSDGNAVHAAVENGEVILLVDESVYSRDALLRTCYWFTDRCYLFVSRAGLGVFSVRIRAKAGGAALDTISGEFENALIDQQVRHDIARETERLRELVVAKAFAEGQELDDAPVGDYRDPVDMVRAKTGGTDGER